MNDLLETVNLLINKQIGDLSRLEHIKITLEQNKILYTTDKEYVDSLVNRYFKQESNIKPKKIGNEQNATGEEKIEPPLVAKKSRFSFKKKTKKKNTIPDEALLHYDWFFDKVKFRRQSNLAIVIGILTIISSFAVFGMINTGSNSSFSNAMAGISAFIAWIVIVLAGITLISLGAREVPRYPSLANAIEDYVKDEIKKSKM